MTSFNDLLATAILASFLVILTRTDLRERRLPDRLTLPLLGIGLLVAAWRSGAWPGNEIVGSAAGGLLFYAIGEVVYRTRGVEALGLGDAKLFAAAGAWVGWEGLPSVLMLSTLGALAYIGVKHLLGGQIEREIVFGPWLALGFAAVWLAQYL